MDAAVFVGVGMQVRKGEDGTAVVAGVKEGGPAEEQNIAAGDKYLPSQPATLTLSMPPLP